MPIIVKDFSWSQSESKVFLNLPLKGTKGSNVDILNSSEYFKVAYPPFLFECWLFDKIDDEKCIATINNGIISLQLNKLEEKTWDQLFNPEHENKDLMKQIREAAVIFSSEKVNRLAKEKSQIREENKRNALREQMEIESKDRTRINSIKENEKKKTSEEIEQVKEMHKASFQSFPQEKTNKSDGHNEKSLNTNQNEPLKSKNIFESVGTQQMITKYEKTEITPSPRNSGLIQVKFTPRVFPTPSRESQEKQEQEWLQNQLESRQLDSFPEELAEYSKEEMNVDWLKDKASQFYKNCNYQSAISVYNHAIRLYPKMPSLYSNRAACHFQVRNLMKCIEDCSRALELLVPPVEKNRQNRLKAHIRRGTAFCELELYAEGLMDYEVAIKLDPDNEQIKNDAENIRRIIQGNPIV